MSPRIGVLGAGGMQAGAMLAALARSEALEPGELVGIDRRWTDEARARLDAQGAEVWTCDIVADREELTSRVESLDLLANLAGPFYALGTRPLETAIDAGVDYLDVCDDGDAVLAALELHERARAAGIRALVGMGSSPGMTNVLIRAALDALPAEEAGVEISWLVDTADMTPGVLEHMFHCFATAMPEARGTPGWDELDPRAVAFPEPVDSQVVVTLGHPEPLTFPRFTRAATVVNRGGIAPESHLRFAWRLARLRDQLGDSTPDADLLFQLYADLRDATPTPTRVGSGLQIDVLVGSGGFRIASGAETSMEEATGTPAAAGVLLMLGDPGLEPGVWSPECLVPKRVFEKLRLVSAGGGGLHMMRLADGKPGERVRIRDLIAAPEGVR